MCKVLSVHRSGFYAWMKEPQSNTEKDNVRLLEQIKALLMAVWLRPTATQVIVHTDQGSQYASSDYLDLLKAHDLIPSMSR